MKLTDVIEEHYEKIDKETITKIKIEKSHTTETLLNIFLEDIKSKKNELMMKSSLDSFTLQSFWSTRIEPFIKDITPEEITKISICLSDFQNEENFSAAGIFLTALINTHSQHTDVDVEYKIITSHLDTILLKIGEENEARIRVCGNAGSFLGMHQRGGIITVEGDCHSEVGYAMYGGMITVQGNVHENVGSHMSGGTITISGNVEKDVSEYMTGGIVIIKGNVKNGLAEMMKGGEIHVYGNAGKDVGTGMRRGTMYLHGTYENISNEFRGGKIYHQEKLIDSSLKQLAKKGVNLVKDMFGKR